ncbi:MAG: hypothetical protein U0572_01955 [Phycisphaerales bacterium]
MEFVELDEIWQDLARRGVVEMRRADVGVEMAVDATKRAAVVELAPKGTSFRAPTTRVEVPLDRIASTLEAILHKLHLSPVYLIPVVRWRNVFEVVSFGLAKNAHWQDIESQASVELNTRDAIECGQRDLHTLRDLVNTLLVDGDEGDLGVQQGLVLVATGQLVVARIAPHRPVHLEFESASVAQNACDAAHHFLGRNPDRPTTHPAPGT